jgi:iron complex transport system substrate-binding protein
MGMKRISLRWRSLLGLCLAFVLACPLALAGCAGETAAGTGDAGSSAASTDAGSGAITITDMVGRSVTLDGPASRVITTMPGDCEIVYALGAEDKLIARGEYCDYPAAALDLPVVTTGGETNIEQLISLKPDLVIMSTMGQTVEQSQQLENAGIKVLASQSTSIDGVYQAIEMIGQALGEDDEASKLVSDMQTSFEQLQQQAAAQANKGGSIYFEVSPLEYGLYTAGTGTFMNEIAQMLSLENCFGDLPDWAQVSEEQVIARNPSYIVTISMYMGEGPTPEQEIMARPGWDGIAAVQNGDVWCLGNDELSRPSPRLVEAVQMLYDEVYG